MSCIYTRGSETFALSVSEIPFCPLVSAPVSVADFFHVLLQLPVRNGNRLLAHACRLLLSRIGPSIRPDLLGAVKPNYAFFAQDGFPGLKALEKLIDHVRALGYPVILDAKRGDIGNTSKAYAREVFDFWGVDAVKVAP